VSYSYYIDNVNKKESKMEKLSQNAKRAINNYTEEVCLKALRMNEVDGEGAYTTGLYLGLTTNQADAAINAGREITKAAKQ
jgi:hypothetical protein